MTLKEVIEGFNEISLKQPSVKQYIKSGNIYDLSSERNTKFGVFCCTQGTHTSNIQEGYTTYNLFLYYVDRLSSDESNKLEIQSVALDTLRNIVKTFVNKYDVETETIDYEVFTERFSELCAGAYATISLTDYNENCTEYFD